MKFINKIRNIISNYFWIGLGLILISIILDLKFPSPSRDYVISIIIKLIEAVGLSIFISAIFSYATETKKFASYIKDLLENIVIKRDFLSNIDPESKKKALRSLIQPSNNELNNYPNIGNYYGYFIERTLDISKKSVRSNYHINNRAYFDSSKGKVAIEGTYTYWLFPSDSGYLPIIVGFEQPKDIGSFCSYLHVTTPNGERKSLENLELTQEENESGTISKTELDITEFGKNHEHLNVELKVTEIGNDKLQLLQFKALQPTDGFRFELYCEDNLVIVNHAIFVVGAKYYTSISEDKKQMVISCNQWINEGSGLSIMIEYKQT